MENCVSDLLLSARSLREVFFPRKCVVCGSYLSLDEQDVCEACLEELPLTYQWDIVQHAGFERLARRFEVQDVAALFFFGAESDYRKILYSIKYGGRRALGRRMGTLLGGYLAGSRGFGGCQAVVPVPLHPLRRWKRGYNQSEEIARGVAAAMNLPLETALLRRHRRTKTQTHLSGSAKTANVQGAFRINADCARTLQAQGIRHLLLVDDTLTSGSTLAACAAPLLEAGFQISCTTLAIVPA
jgi:predicted amidophosphoribosyltransferase